MKKLILSIVAAFAFVPALIAGQSYGDTACVCKYPGGGYYGIPVTTDESITISEDIDIELGIQDNWSPSDDNDYENMQAGGQPLLGVSHHPYKQHSQGSYGSYSSPGAGYGYMPVVSPPKPPMPPPAPKLFGPCVHVSSAVANSWVNGNQPYTYYQYVVRIDNQCSKPLYQQYVYAKPFGNITESWNVEVLHKPEVGDDAGKFGFPLWAATFGVPAGESLEFGFISIGEVIVSRENL